MFISPCNLDYEQVDGDSGDEEDQQRIERSRHNKRRRSISSSYCTASTSIDTNDCTEPLNSESTATDSVIDMGTKPPMYEDRKIASNFDKFRLLMWKNVLLFYRHKIQSVIEIMVPVLFSVILILIRSIVDPDLFPNKTVYNSFDISTLRPLRLVLQLNTYETIETICMVIGHSRPLHGFDREKTPFLIAVCDPKM